MQICQIVGARHEKLNMNRLPKASLLLPAIITFQCRTQPSISLSLVEARVSDIYPEAKPGYRKDHDLRLPEHHPRPDHPKEMPNVPTTVDRITC